MNRPVPHRYAGYRSYVRPIPDEHMPKTGVVFRYPDEAEHAALKERNLLPFKVANDRFAGPPRHYRIGEQTLLDLFAGIAFWFLVGMAPALCVLAVIVLAK
jgi:hypothetical protein